MPWISLEVEMPKVGQSCLLYQTFPPETMFNCRADPLSRTFIQLGGLTWDGLYKSYYAQWGDKGLEHVTHWMPLPEKP